MFRKTVVATAIIGAGLGSMSGAAFAGEAPHDHDKGHHKSHDKGHHKNHDKGNHEDDSSDRGSARPVSTGDSCSNGVAASNSNSSGRTLGDTNGGAQTIDASNLCHILSGNEILSNSNIAVLGGDITDGDTITSTVSDITSITG